MGRSGPGGSSSGSAVGVSAGFAPLALGTETSGSVVMPANRAGLYAMTPTRGAVSLEGVFALSRDFDKIGAMAKGAADLALLMGALGGVEVDESIGRGWEHVAIGFVDPRVWDAFRYNEPRDESVDAQIVCASSNTRSVELTHGARLRTTTGRRLRSRNAAGESCTPSSCPVWRVSGTRARASPTPSHVSPRPSPEA